MKKLYSLGCSFMSTDSRYLDRPSFLDMFAEKKGYNHISLARPGASNFTIRLQIDRAIQDRADYIVIGATSSDRIDLSVHNFSGRGSPGLSNVRYQGYNTLSEKWIQDTKESYIISDTLNNVIEKDRGLEKERVTSIKYYLRDIHCPDIQDIKDRWIIRDGLNQISKQNIEFVFIPGPLFYFDWSEFGNHVWKGTQPWDMPDGIDEVSINHNPLSAHAKFCVTLESMTQQPT